MNNEHNENRKLNLDNLEINKEVQDTQLNMKELNNVSGGIIRRGDHGGYEIITDTDGKLIGPFRTLEEARFVTSGVCPRCGKVFSDKQAIENHIKEWASGQM